MSYESSIFGIFRNFYTNFYSKLAVPIYIPVARILKMDTINGEQEPNPAVERESK